MLNIPESVFNTCLSQVKLLALDVDGVLTDGGLYYSNSGEEMKKFNVKDGLGIKQVMRSGIQVAIISASSAPSILHRARVLGITHTYISVEDKLATLRQLCDRLSLSLTEVAYMGDDVIDLSVLRSVGCPITVADAMPENQAQAIYVTHRNGGQAAVREVCDLLLRVRTSVLQPQFSFT